MDRGVAAPAGGSDRGLPAGATLIELVLALGVVSLGAVMSAPALAGAVEAGRARAAAQFLASQCRLARMEATARNSTASLVFDLAGARWRFRRCLDGNGNGMRRADITSGKDTCVASTDIGDLFAAVRIGVAPGLPDPDGGAATIDAVRFGSSDIASFTPSGTATSGTVYLRSDGGLQYAVRVAGTTGRVRVLRYEPTTRTWAEI